MATGNLQPVRVIARVLVLTERRVQQLAAEGILPKPARGQYDFIECVRAYILHQRKIIEERQPGSVSVLEGSRSRLIAAKAGLAELDESERREQLIPASQIEDFLSALFSRVRQGILSLPSRVAPRAHDAKTIPEAERIILEGCEEALKEISETRIEFKAIDPGSARARAHRPRDAADSTATA